MDIASFIFLSFFVFSLALLKHPSQMQLGLLKGADLVIGLRGGLLAAHAVSRHCHYDVTLQ